MKGTLLRLFHYSSIIFFSLCGFLAWSQTAQAYSYENYTLDDLNVTSADTSFVITHTVPDDLTDGMSTNWSYSLSTPYLYSYDGGEYQYDYVDISNAVITSDQMTVTYQGSSYATFQPTSALQPGDTITITVSGVTEPDSMEGTGSFSVYGYDYSDTAAYKYFWGSVSQVYGDVDATITMLDADGVTPVSNVYVSMYYYNVNNYSDYDYHYGYTNAQGEVQFAGLENGDSSRDYTVYFYYSGNATTNDPPASSTVTYAGTPIEESFNFAEANVLTHFYNEDGNPINNAGWSFYNTNWTSYSYGTTDEDGTIAGAAQTDGSYTLYVTDPDSYNSYSTTFTVTNGEVSGLVDPFEIPSPEVEVTITADDSPVNNVYTYIHNDDWTVYRYGYTNSDGQVEFSLGESDEYELYVSSYGLPSGYYSPGPQTINVTAGESLEPITLELLSATKTVSGTVTMTGDEVADIQSGTPVTDAYVSAWQTSSYNYTSAQVDSNGNFELDLTGGSWQIYVWQQTYPYTWAFVDGNINVSFNDDETVESSVVDIEVKPYNSTITATFEYPDGTPVSANSLYMYVYGGENNRVWAYGYNDANGVVEVNTTEGTFEVYTYFYNSSGNNNYSIPKIDPQTVPAGETIDLGTITLVEDTSHIQGTMSLRSTGEGISNQYISAYKQDGGWSYKSTTTDENGFYDLLLGAGDWIVSTYTYGLQVNGKNVIYTGGSEYITVADGETAAGVDFTLDLANADISIEAVDSDGNKLDDEHGWASVADSEATADYNYSSTGCYVQDGACTFAAASDVPYEVNYYSYSNWNVSDDSDNQYSFSHVEVDGQQTDTVTLTESETKQVSLVMSENDATITVNFVDDEGVAANITGYVYAQGPNNSWVSTYVDNESSTSLKVGAGVWDINYWVYGDYMSPYQESIEVEAVSNTIVAVDVDVYNQDGTIAGQVVDADGNVVTSPVLVKASTSYGSESSSDSYLIERTTYTDSSGNFSMAVPKGTYYVTIANPNFYSGQPVEVVANNSGRGEGLMLAFVDPTARITGIVTDGTGITVNNNRVMTVGDVIEDVFVYSYCVTGTYDTDYTDSTGTYELAVPAGDTCYVGAIQQADKVAYYAAEVEIKVSEDSIEQDLALDYEFTIPEAQIVKFAPTEGKMLKLDDGTVIEIAPNAITVDETVTEITVIVTPRVEAVRQPGLLPLKVTYEFTALDNNDSPITQFAGEVKITLPYTEEDLTEAGVTEGEIHIRYYEDAAGAWQSVDSAEVKDSDNDSITVSVDHFSSFAILSSGTALVSDNSNNNEEDSGDNEDGILRTPKNVRVKKRSDHQVQATWKRVDSASSYQVQVVNKKTGDAVRTVRTNKRKVNVSKLLSNKQYKLQVRSVADTGTKSGWSSAKATRTKPGAPTSIAVKQDDNAVEISWKKSRGVITRYTVVIEKSNGATIRKHSRQASVRIPTLSAGGYTVKVQAQFNKKNVSEFSNTKAFNL